MKKVIVLIMVLAFSIGMFAGGDHSHDKKGKEPVATPKK